MGHKVSKAFSAVGNVLEDAVKDVDKAVTFVGDKAAHLVQHIPVFGDILAGGIDGVTELAHQQSLVYQRLGDAAFHPLDTLEAATRIVTSPAALGVAAKGLARTALRTTSKCAGAAGKIAKVVSIVDPEEGDSIQDSAKLVKFGADTTRHAMFSAGTFNERASEPNALAALIPRDKHCGENVLESLNPLAAYLSGCYPSNSLTVHLFRADGTWVAAVELHPVA